MKALVGTFNQEKALVGAFSVIVKTGCGTDGALHSTTHKPRSHSAFDFNICCWFAAAAAWHCWSWWYIQTCKAMFEHFFRWQWEHSFMSPSTINKRQKLLGAIVCEKCHSMLHLSCVQRREVSTPSLIITIQFRQTFLLGSAGIWGSSSFMKKPNNNMRSKHCRGWQKRRRGKGVELETKVIRRFAKISQSWRSGRRSLLVESAYWMC